MFLYEKDNMLIGIIDNHHQIPAEKDDEIDFKIWKDKTDNKVHCIINNQEICD